MIDPSNALESFQEQFLYGNIKLQRGDNPSLYVHYETFDDNSFRLTYVRLENRTVTAFVNVVPCASIGKVLCFQIGYAVPKAYRNRGLAKETINMVISEMQNGYRRAGIPTFYIEAIVEVDNKPSQRVAENVISTDPVTIVDELSGLEALQYLRKIE